MKTPTARRKPVLKTRDIRLSVDIKSGAEQIYRALTAATELCRWWLEGAETDARNAGRFRMLRPALSGAGGRRPRWEREGAFVDLEPGRKVAWIENGGGRKGVPPLASFFIETRGAHCGVTLQQSGFSSAGSSDRLYEACLSDWRDCLAKLKLYLETGRVGKKKMMTLEARA